jgi:hemolysin III
MKKYNAISMVCYVCTGWAILFCIKIAYKALTPKGFMWILAGGISYTIGAIIYGIGKKRKLFHGVGVVFYVVLRI